MPPSNINMQPILAALQMRQQGQLGGGGTPMQQQSVTQPPVTPQTSAGSMPVQVPQGAGQGQQTQNGALQAGQKAQGPMFDQQTRDLSKALVKKLLDSM